MIFLFGAGCVLQLDERGVVAISANRPANADRVLAVVSTGDGRVELDLAGRTELTVPAGTVSISGEARSGTEVLARDEETVEVGAGATVEVLLDLTLPSGDAGAMDTGAIDGAGPEVRSPPIEATVRVRTDGIAGGFVLGEGTSDESAFLAFRADAQDTLGSIAEIAVEGVSIQLLPSSQGVAVLGDLFSDEIVASIIREDDSASVEIARGTASSGSIQAELAAIPDADFGTVSGSLMTGRFKVGLRGATPRTTSDVFDADVRTAITFVAR
jgi:hypothetical protein